MPNQDTLPKNKPKYLNQEWLNELMWTNTPQWQKDQLNEERKNDSRTNLDDNRTPRRL